MSSRPSRAVSADLAAANAALDVCVALLRAQGGEIPEPRAAATSNDDTAKRESAALEMLRQSVEKATAGHRESDRAAAAARQIADFAAKLLEGQRADLASQTPRSQPVAAPVVRDHATQRALRAAIDRYFSYFEIPGTGWRLSWQLFSESGLPSATAYGTSPGPIEGAYAIALPEEMPWRRATKLIQIELASKSIQLSSGGKPVAASKYFVAGLAWARGAGSITLSRSKKKLTGAVRVAFPGDGSVSVAPLDIAGNAAGPPSSQDPHTTAYLDAVWWKLSAAAMGLVHGRGDAVSLRFAGAEVADLANPAQMAEAVRAGNATLLAKVFGEVDAEMKAKLLAKFDDLPARYRDKYAGTSTAASANGPMPTSKPEAKPARAASPAAPAASPAPAAKVASAATVAPTAPIRAAEEPIRPSRRITTNTVTRPAAPRATKAAGSGPIPNPAKQLFASAPRVNSARPTVGRPSDHGAPLFGQNTIDEKFSDLDLEIDWDEELPTQMREDDTLPGVVPSTRRPTTVTVRR